MGAPGLRRTAVALGIAAAIVAVDQATKAWAVAELADGPIILVEGILRLALVFNPGAAFSSFQGIGPLLAILAVAVAGWIVVLIRRTERSSLELVALALVLGGAVGNLVDRVTRGPGTLDGAVVDFIDFAYFPTFNVADSAITIGAVLLVLLALRGSAGRIEEAADATSPPDRP